MAWPGPSDYKAVLQDPGRAFADPRLRAGRPELDRWGMPKGRAGGFAIVYRLSNGTAATAVRVYLAPPRKEREDRYRVVHQYLARGKPRCVVDFGYHREAICVGSQWLPIQTLQWVDGVQLGEWVGAAVGRRDAAQIRRMADLWIDLVDELRACRVAHGDLQHGNVLVVGDALVLVDYDCLCVPDLVGQEAWEYGLPAYQHPERPLQPLSLEMDHFSAWVILIALRATAADLSLWTRFVEAKDNENLLFTETDITRPDQSPLWPALLASPDPDVRAWSRALRESIGRPFDQIPPFRIDTFGPLRAACAGTDWDAIWDLARSPRYAGKPLPPGLAPVIDSARRRVEARDRLRAAFRGQDPRGIARAYQPALLDDWPACRDLSARARAVVETVKALDELTAAAARPGDGRALVALWARHAPRVGQLAEADAVRQEADRWRRRIEAVERFLAALRAGRPERELAAAWKQLADAGGHPDAAPHQARAETATRRATALEALHDIPPTEDEETDRRLCTEWDAAASLLDPCREADALRARALAARPRLALADQLRAVIDRADRGLETEQQVLDAAAQLPPGYAHAHQPRVQAARLRLASATTLLEALKAVPQSDRLIAEAWEKLRGAGSEPRDRDTLDRCRLALRRRDLMDQLSAIPQTLPVDEQGALWLGRWDEALLRDSHDARPLRARLEEARARKAAWEALEAALDSGDIPELIRLQGLPLLSSHPGILRRQKEIAELVQAGERLDHLIQTLKAGEPDAFLRLFDPSLLRDHAPAFAPYRRQIEAWVDERILRAGPLSPGQPPYLIGEGARHVTARWTWRHAPLVPLCRVAADPAQVLERPEDARGGTFRVRVEQHRRAGGYVLSVPPGWREMYVTVWPVVDLGWAERVGPPVALGPIALGDGRPKPPADGGRSLLQGLLEKMLNW